MLAKSERYDVPMRTLHSLFAELGFEQVDVVSLLKVDTEGAEVEVRVAASLAIALRRPCQFVPWLAIDGACGHMVRCEH